MKICFIIEYYPPHVGGGETLFCELAQGLAQRGHTCDVITCRLPGTKKFEVVNGVRVHRVWAPRWGDRYWFTFLALPKAIKTARKSDVCHTMTYNGAFPAWVASAVAKKPVALLAHEVLGKRWHDLGLSPVEARMYRFLEKLVLCLPFDAYPCNSLATQSALVRHGILPSRVHQFYPGVDSACFCARSPDKAKQIRQKLGLGDAFVCLYYGRPGVVKGVEYLVQAARYLAREIDGFHLVLILSQKPVAKRRQIMRLVAGLEPGLVTVLDPVAREELPDYILACDCVAVPSLNEGFGFTCVEACALGKPVVATTAGSLPEVIFGKHVLVIPGSARALADGIVRAWKADFVQSRARKYSWDTFVSRHIEMYESLMSQHG